MNGVVSNPNSPARFGKSGDAAPPVAAQKPLCVLQVIPSLDAGGAERACLDVAAALRAEGSVALVASQGGRMAVELTQLGGVLIELPVAAKNPLRVVINAFRLARLVRHYGVDILHVRSRAPAWSVWFAAAMTGVPWLATFHGFYGAGNRPKRFYNSVMLWGARVIAGSDFMAAHIAATYNMPADRIVTIARGIDVRHFDPGAVDDTRVAALRRALAIPDGALVALLPARLTRWKGQLLFTEALAKLNRADVVGVLAGDAQGRDAYTEEIRALARRYGIAGRLRVAGNLADMPAAYKLASVAVSASLDAEAFGRVPVEAMAMGCRVIAADHGGASETLRSDAGVQLGYLFTPGDANALCAALQAALDAPAAASRHSEIARAHVCANYATRVMCQRTLALYREILAGR